MLWSLTDLNLSPIYVTKHYWDTGICNGQMLSGCFVLVTPQSSPLSGGEGTMDCFSLWIWVVLSLLPCPRGRTGIRPSQTRNMLCNSRMCRKFRERGMAGLLRTGKQRACEPSAAGSHQPPQQGRLCVKIADREEKHSKDVERGRLHPLGSGITEASSAPQLYMNY